MLNTIVHCQVEARLVQAGWEDKLLTVKVLSSTDREPPGNEVVLTFLDAASAADFVNGPAVPWPGPNSSADGPPLDRVLLANMEAVLAAARQMQVSRPPETTASSEGVAATEQVVILLPKEEFEEEGDRVSALCESWTGVLDVHRLPLTSVQYTYGAESGRIALRPAALVTFSTSEQAATVAAQPTVGSPTTGWPTALVMLYLEYLNLPTTLFADTKKMQARNSKNKRDVPSAEAKTTAGPAKEEGPKFLPGVILESEREIVCMMPAGPKLQAKIPVQNKEIPTQNKEIQTQKKETPSTKPPPEKSAGKGASTGTTKADKNSWVLTSVVVGWLNPKNAGKNGWKLDEANVVKE